jgi:predicted RNA polymerase sigma factor
VSHKLRFDRVFGEVESLERDGRLTGYRYLQSTKADLLRRLGRHHEAAHSYRAALDLTDNEAERRFLASRLVERSSRVGVLAPRVRHKRCRK